MAATTTVTVTEKIPPYRQDIRAGNHSLVADEPASLGGQDAGPAPYEFLLSALGACTNMTLRMYAARKQWPLENVSVALTHRKEDDGTGFKRDVITRRIALTGALDDEQRTRLHEIADKCPVHKTLEAGARIETELA
jgi:uncharacterized OsmC-like protein